MKYYINRLFYPVLFTILLITSGKTFAQNGNFAFVFNNEGSRLYVEDGAEANTGANQNGFQFFNSSADSNQITVQAWIYLLGDTPADVEVPIVYRAVDGGTTFSLYVKNNKGYFSVGNNNSATVSTPEFPAFRWVALTGKYDGSILKIYLDGDPVEPGTNFAIEPGYTTLETGGLYVSNPNSGSFRGLIDEIRIFDVALGDNNINNSGGNGNPAEKFPSSIAEFLRGQWSFDAFSAGNLLYDLSAYKNHLHIEDITQKVPSKNLPFLVVTSTLDGPDAVPGDGKALSLNGNATLRSAIEEANALAGQQIVYFYLSGSTTVIEPLSALPPVIQPVILDGTVQKGYIDTPVVRVNGAFGGLTIDGGGSTVQGLDIHNSAGYGLTLSSAGSNNIAGNRLSGISINSPGNAINGNTISNSVVHGISINAGAINNQIGVSDTNQVINNSGFGIFLNGGSNNTIANNIVKLNGAGGILVAGGTGAITANMINTNFGPGIGARATDGSTITENTIAGNTGNGIELSGNNHVLTHNFVTENDSLGLSVTAGTGNQIANNIFEANDLGGVAISGNSVNLTKNIVTGNFGYGISLSASNTIIRGNRIFENAGDGVAINGDDNLVEQDTIYNNGISGSGAGVLVESGSNNSILYNSIYDNADPGTQLGASANDSQVYPTLNVFYTWQDESVESEVKGGTFIEGILNGPAGESYKVQFFANTGTGTREGERYLDEVVVTTDISDKAEIIANFKDVVVYPGEVVSATATRLAGDGSTLSTSEFSESIERNNENGDHYIVNTTLAGIPLHWKDGNGDYQIAPSLESIAGYAAAVENGFNTWSQLSQIDYVKIPTNGSEKWGGNADGINNVVWFPTTEEWEDSTGAPTNVVAVTRVRYNALNGEMVDIDIAFNGIPVSITTGETRYWGIVDDVNNELTSNLLDVQNVATHEIGHYSGLADLYNPGDEFYRPGMGNNNHPATMYGRIDRGENYKRTLYPDEFAIQETASQYDIGGINSIYGNLGAVYYDLVLVFDGTTNFTSPEVLNGFGPSKKSAVELLYRLRKGDRIGVFNGTGSFLQVTDDIMGEAYSYLNNLQINPTGDLAYRISEAENLLSSSNSGNKQRFSTHSI